MRSLNSHDGAASLCASTVTEDMLVIRVTCPEHTLLLIAGVAVPDQQSC